MTMSNLTEGMSSLSDNSSVTSTRSTKEYLDLVYIVVCTTQIVIGLFCNIISLKVFMRSGNCSPIILQRLPLILLTLSNTFYLVAFFYSQILQKLASEESAIFGIEGHLKEAFKAIYISNHSAFVCRSIQYSLNVAICLNATITTSFSLERAFAIKFPYLSINLRENHHVQFKILIIFLLLFSFLLPSYNLYFATLVTSNDSITRCSVKSEDSTVYFYLTVPYVLFTLLLPFLIISFSNYTIIKEIVKNNRDHRRRTLISIRQLANVSANHQAAGNSSHQQQQQFNDHDLNYNNSNNMPDQEARTIPLITHHMNKQNNNNNTNNIINIINSSMAPSLRITSHIATNMLVAISMSWLILNLPYFIVWCIFTLHIMIKAENIEPAFLYQLSQIKTITEMFVLMNYSMAGLLYFVSGKMYREHLYAILGCAARRKRLSLSRVL